tara:strand:+ start:478 stop:1305 length:828 start_codon:yes stop_codon:yes gene_type:complete
LKSKRFLLPFIFTSFLFSQDLNLLTYNIHGLNPIIAGDDPYNRIPIILSKITEYDIIFFQENWIYDNNSFSSMMESYNVFSTSYSKFFWPINKLINSNGAGLSLAISKSIDLIDSSEHLFEYCSGWLSKDNDCFASKGFQHLRVRIDGQILDLYNTHFDAGRSESDKNARLSQLNQLQKYIKVNSANYPVIIAGDLNILYESIEYKIIDSFIIDNKFALADWSSDLSKSKFGKLDYILYKSSNETNINFEKCKVDTNLRGLSDHPAIQAVFNLEN